MRLTTAEMAKLSGVSQRTLQDIEQERSEGSVQTMNRIPDVLGLRLGACRIIAPPLDRDCWCSCLTPTDETVITYLATIA